MTNEERERANLSWFSSGADGLYATALITEW
jgi:hypothetical protein